MPSNVNRTRRGVTLIEMLVVVTIIGLFTGVIGVKYFHHVEKSKQVAAKSQLAGFTAAIASYYAEHGVYPAALSDVRQYLTNDVPLDPWSRPYVYEPTADGGPRVICLGADGLPGGDGVNADVFSWK